MTWLTVLIAAAVVAAVVAVMRIQPPRTRPIARTRLMGVARVALLVVIAIVLYVVWQWHSAT